MQRYVPCHLKKAYTVYWYTIITKRYTVYVIAKFLPNVRLLYISIN